MKSSAFVGRARFTPIPRSGLLPSRHPMGIDHQFHPPHAQTRGVHPPKKLKTNPNFAKQTQSIFRPTASRNNLRWNGMEKTLTRKSLGLFCPNRVFEKRPCRAWVANVLLAPPLPWGTPSAGVSFPSPTISQSLYVKEPRQLYHRSPSKSRTNYLLPIGGSCTNRLLLERLDTTQMSGQAFHLIVPKDGIRIVM